MSVREALFALLLLAAAGLVTVGAAVVHESAGLIVGGVLLAAWSWLILAEDGE